MKQILIALLMLCSINAKSQDTLCVMICLDEIIHFDYQTSDITNRYLWSNEFNIDINNGEVICLHFSDDKRMFRDVTTKFTDGDMMRETFNTKDHVVYSKADWPAFSINISLPRKRK